MAQLSGAQRQSLSNTELDEFLGALPAAPVVPPVPGQPDLPFNALSPGQFERLCKRLIEQDAEVEHCYLYGKPGGKQFGIDIVARRADGQRLAYQCKRYESYTLGDLRKALEKLTYLADRYVFAVSCDVGRELRDEVEERSPPTEIWGIHELSDKLRGYPDLVTQFFGPDWCREFCGVSRGLSVRDYLAAVDDYCRNLPYLSLADLSMRLGASLPSADQIYIPLQVQLLRGVSEVESDGELEEQLENALRQRDAHQLARLRAEKERRQREGSLRGRPVRPEERRLWHQ